jgi:hypothetical protein
VTESLYDVSKKITRFDSSPIFDPFTKVVVRRSQDEEFHSGNESGRTLTIECPWGTQRIADGLLLQIGGYAYQPFDATGAIISPALELGDEITVNGLESFLYRQDITFGPLFMCDISAPDGEEIDHEFPYVNPQDKKTNREIATVKTAQKDQYTELNDRILALENLLKNTSRKTANVSTPNGGSVAVNYLGWEESKDG